MSTNTWWIAHRGRDHQYVRCRRQVRRLRWAGWTVTRCDPPPQVGKPRHTRRVYAPDSPEREFQALVE